MPSRDLRDARCRRIGPSQRPANLVQPPQQEITRGTYAEKFGATHSQRSLRYTDLGTERGNVELVVDALADYFLETNHDGSVTPSRSGIIARIVNRQAIDDRVERFLLQGSRYFRPLNQSASVFCKTAGLCKKALEAQYLRA